MTLRDMTLGLMRRSRPVWAGNFIDPRSLLPGGARLDPATFPATAAQADVTVTLTAQAAENAVTLAVAALSGPIPAGASLNFGVGIGFVIVRNPAAAAATAIDIYPTANIIPSGSAAVHQNTGKRTILSGTLVSRTYAPRAAKARFHAAVVGEDEYYLVAFDVEDANTNDEFEPLKPSKSFTVKENFLPGFAALSAGLQAVIRTNWNTTVGVEGG
jgi:hypothetical protein